MGKILSPCRCHRYIKVYGQVYITDFWNVKWLPQHNQLYSLSEIIIMLELETLPTDLSDNVNFF
jgi:hypothetical protein